MKRMLAMHSPCFVDKKPLRALQMEMSYLSHVDVFGDDLCTGLRRELAEHHQLDPLRHSVEQSDGALQSRVLHQAAVDHIALVISELQIKWFSSISQHSI